MTNFEKYKDEILGISRTQAIAINKRRNAPEKCSCSVCSECLLHEGRYCNQKAIFQWLYSEYQEPAPKLTKAERGFCEIVKTGYIARDAVKKCLLYYSEEPEIDLNGYYRYSPYDSVELPLEPFSFITWGDEKPWSIEELLKLEVEE